MKQLAIGLACLLGVWVNAHAQTQAQSSFDILGVRFGMTPEQVLTAMQQHREFTFPPQQQRYVASRGMPASIATQTFCRNKSANDATYECLKVYYGSTRNTVNHMTRSFTAESKMRNAQVIDSLTQKYGAVDPTLILSPYGYYYQLDAQGKPAKTWRECSARPEPPQKTFPNCTVSVWMKVMSLQKDLVHEFQIFATSYDETRLQNAADHAAIAAFQKAEREALEKKVQSGGPKL